MSSALTLTSTLLKPHSLSSSSSKSSSSSSKSSLPITGIRTKSALGVQCRSATATCHAPTAAPSPPFSDNLHHSLSLYEILRVKETATLTEIKTAYRTLAKLYHPDAMSGSESESEYDGLDFIEIHNAYATLSDPAARAIYDLSLGSNIRRRSVRAGFYPTRRRWETDQCW